MKSKVLMLMMVVVTILGLQSCSCSKSEAVKAEVDDVKELLPAKMWDGFSLAAVKCEGNEVVFELVKDKLNDWWLSASESELKEECSDYFVSEFVKAYLDAANGDEGEGEEKLYIKVYPLLERIADGGLSLKFVITDKKKNSVIAVLSAEEVKLAMEK